jgi:hypothetical protein
MNVALKSYFHIHAKKEKKTRGKTMSVFFYFPPHPKYVDVVVAIRDTPFT